MTENLAPYAQWIATALGSLAEAQTRVAEAQERLAAAMERQNQLSVVLWEATHGALPHLPDAGSNDNPWDDEIPLP